MSAVAKPRSNTAVVVPPQIGPSLHRFSVDQYHRMAEIGVLTPADRVELIHGYIVDKMTQHPPHAASVGRSNRLLARVLPDDWVLRTQTPITLRDSEPEPDILIAVGPEERYSHRHPTPRDTALLIEIADSSLLQDRLDKIPLYAAERVVECWLVNLVDQRVEVYTKPRGGRTPGFQKRQDYLKDAKIPLILLNRQICLLDVRALLPA